MTKPLNFYCKIHQEISSHKPTFLINSNNFGCNLCARESVGKASRLTKQDVLNKHKANLPNHIKILAVIYDKEKQSSGIKIHCKKHGESIVTNGFMSRSEYKCPDCGNESVGYASNRFKELVKKKSMGKPCYVGVMKVEVFGIPSLKVGVTTKTLEERYKWHLKKIFFSTQMTEVEAYILENQIHRRFKKNHDAS